MRGANHINPSILSSVSSQARYCEYQDFVFYSSPMTIPNINWIIAIFFKSKGLTAYTILNRLQLFDLFQSACQKIQNKTLNDI